MSAERLFQAALAAALSDALGERLNAVLIGPAATATGPATAPYAELGELLSADWSTKDALGRELRSLVTIRDTGDAPARLHDLADDAAAAIAAISPALPPWHIASLVLVRQRLMRERTGWAALIEHRARLLWV